MDKKAARSRIATSPGDNSSSEDDGDVEAVAAGVQKHLCQCSRDFEDDILKNERPQYGPEKKRKIMLKILSQDGKWVKFQIPSNMKFEKIKIAYAKRVEKTPDSIRLLRDGEVLLDQTPDELEMDDEEQIDAVLHTVGGGYVY